MKFVTLFSIAFAAFASAAAVSNPDSESGIVEKRLAFGTFY